MALFSNNSSNGRYRTEAQMNAQLVSAGLSLEAVIERARDFSKPVQEFENLAGSTWHTSGGTSVVDIQTEGEYAAIQGPGTLAMSTYWQDAELTWEAIERAVERSSFGDALTALTHGVAAVENYINYRAQRWNFSHASQPLLDSKSNKVSFDEKIDQWLPIMTGNRLERGGREWADFLALRKLRDDRAIHSKSGARGIEYTSLADVINRTRSGLGGLLIQLHLLFEEEIPARIIRLAFAPDVQVATEGADSENSRTVRT